MRGCNSWRNGALGTCEERISSNGDSETCGARTLPGNTYCIQHRVRRLNHHRLKITALERDLAREQAEFEKLLKEGQG